jgi:hypothetical protein
VQRAGKNEETVASDSTSTQEVVAPAKKSKSNQLNKQTQNQILKLRK